VQAVFSSANFRVYTSSDLIGAEVGGALKNVIALAAGCSDGLGFGDNTKAALITRGIAEISRLGIKMGAKEQTFKGLSGIGDLIVTCTSKHSRNWRAGFALAQGNTLDETLKEIGMVVEGVDTAKTALQLARKHDTTMPIIEEVNNVLFGNKDIRTAVTDLMLRERKEED
jgi:glycerol-3-phosphate dehydrogenase (NAD(P)+)